MKQFLIVPTSKVGITGQAFGLIDPDSKEVLHEQYCSSEIYAYGDLMGNERGDSILNYLTGTYGKYEILEDYKNTNFIKNNMPIIKLQE